MVEHPKRSMNAGEIIYWVFAKAEPDRIHAIYHFQGEH